MTSPGLSGDAGVRGLMPRAVQAVLCRGAGWGTRAEEQLPSPGLGLTGRSPCGRPLLPDPPAPTLQ